MRGSRSAHDGEFLAPTIPFELLAKKLLYLSLYIATTPPKNNKMEQKIIQLSQNT